MYQLISDIAQIFRRSKFQGANADTDNYLLKGGLKGRIAKLTARRTMKTDSKHDRDRLKRPEVKLEYGNKFVTRVEESDKNNQNWQTLQQMITETANKVTGKIERVERNEWYDDEYREATKIRWKHIAG
jgi:hypothetical protein